MSRQIRFPSLALSLLVLTACSSSSDDDDGLDPLFTPRSTSHGVSAVLSNGAPTPIALSGRYMAYLADETASGVVDMNGDGDEIDSVVSVVEIVEREETVLGVAALDVAWLGGVLFIAVREDQDGTDWDADGDSASADEIALLCWQPGDATASFVASLDADGGDLMTPVDQELLFFPLAAGAGGAGATSLAYVRASAPQTVVQLTTDSLAAGGLHPRVIGEQEGMLFLTLDETLDGELNADGDATDEAVLAVCDGTSANAMVMNTGLAVRSDDVPFRARFVGDEANPDWLIGFLVDEAGQGLSLNDRDLFAPSLIPDGCSADDDDTNDQVLHYFYYADWSNDAASFPIANTFLPGRHRVFSVADVIGTITFEGDDADCNYNSLMGLEGDNDQTDSYARWVTADENTASPNLDSLRARDDLLALALVPAGGGSGFIPGGTFGVAEFENTIAIVVGEAEDARDHDNDTDSDHDLLALYDSDTGWDFDLRSGSNPPLEPVYVGVDWMGESSDRSWLNLSTQELVWDENLNGEFSTDDDLDDLIPVTALFNGPDIVLPFFRVALTPSNAGMTIVDDVLFYRVDEGNDSRDWNGDGDTADTYLFRTSVDGPFESNSNFGYSKSMSVLSTDVRPAIEYQSDGGVVIGGALIADEAMEGEDFNGDGDTSDLVVRYFLM